MTNPPHAASDDRDRDAALAPNSAALYLDRSAQGRMGPNEWRKLERLSRDAGVEVRELPDGSILFPDYCGEGGVAYGAQVVDLVRALGYDPDDGLGIIKSEGAYRGREAYSGAISRGIGIEGRPAGPSNLPDGYARLSERHEAAVQAALTQRNSQFGPGAKRNWSADAALGGLPP